jgi:hypothetical protein
LNQLEPDLIPDPAILLLAEMLKSYREIKGNSDDMDVDSIVMLKDVSTVIKEMQRIHRVESEPTRVCAT